MNRISKLALGSILVASVALGLKLTAWWVAGSIALLSDALESSVNLITAIGALIAVRVAARPADRKHPFGHHKAEFFSAAFEGLLIIGAAIVILVSAWRDLHDPRLFDMPALGIMINMLATLLNAAWAWALISNGRKLASPALTADGWHLWTDVITSIGVALGLTLAIMTGWRWLDPLAAAIVALHILWVGLQITATTLSALMDEAVPEDRLREIRQIITENAVGAIEIHDLKTRNAGHADFIEFHLVVPQEMTVRVAHEICDRIESAMAKAIPNAKTIIHIEPDTQTEPHGMSIR